jgi:hypothetical protein
MVVEAPPGREFLISDNPVVLNSPSNTGLYGVGYLTRDVEVTMPLSRRHLLLMTHLAAAAGRCCVTEEAMDHFNSRTWFAAQDYVFASSQEVLEQLAEQLHADERRKPGGGITITG